MHRALIILLAFAAAFLPATEAQATTVFTSNFETGSFASEGWTVVNGTQTNAWACGTATNNGGTFGGYVSNDAGVTNAYTLTVSSVTHIYRDVAFPSGEGAITLTFDWRGQGESTFDYMQVFLVPTSTTPVAGTQLTSGQIGAVRYNLQGTYVTANVTIPCSAAGTTQRLVFSWRNDGSLGTQPPAALDNISLTTAASTPLSGNYTIDNTQPTGGTNFASFTAAIGALNTNGSASGGVVFDVIAGQTFTEDPPAIAPLCAAGPITFQRSGLGANPVVRPTGTTGTADFGLCITGTDYVTIDGIDVAINSGSAVEYGILVRNLNATDGAQNCVIKNAKVTLNRVATSSIGILQTTASTGGGTVPTAASGSNSYNKYYDVTVENAYNGISLFCGTASYPDVACEIGTLGAGGTTVGAATANDIGNGSSVSFGIRATAQNGLKIFKTTVRNVTVTGAVNVYGIWLDNSSVGTLGTSEIYGCTVRDLKSTSTSTSSVLYGLRSDVSTGNVARVYNNDVFGLTPSNPTTATTTQLLRALCANTGGNAGTVYDYFNSVRVDQGTALNGTSAAFYGAGGTMYLQNNIIVNVTGAQTTAKHYAAYISSGTVASASNNVYYAPNTNGVVGYASAADRALLEIFAAATSGVAPADGQEGGSANADPNFTSASDLSFGGATPAAESGVTISGITTDITGALRGTPPDIGAHETSNAQSDASAPVLSNVVVVSGGSPTVSVNLTDNSAAGSNAPIRLWYRLGTSGAFTGLDADTKPLGAMNGTYAWNTSLSALATGAYQFYIAARDGRGAGLGLWANPIWTTSFPTSGGWSASDPPDFGTNPAAYANVRTFSKTSSLPGGTYLVGSDEPVLKKLTDVAAQLSASELLGDVIYELKSTYDGTTGETFPIVINQFATLGGNWTVTIRPQAGAGMRTTSGSSTSAIIKLNGADRVILDGREGGTGTASAWTVSNTNAAAATAAIWLSSLGVGTGATNNTVEYLTLSCGTDPSSSTLETYGIVSSGASIATSNDGADNDTNGFLGNIITKARWGIFLRGASGNPNDNCTISGNRIGPESFGTDQIGKGGIVLQHQNAAIVSENEVRYVGVLASQTAGGTDRVGIGLGDFGWTPTATVATNCTVVRNRIHDIVEEKTFAAAGIVVAGTGLSGSPSANTVANNMIYNVRANGTSPDQGVGIGIGAGNGDFVVYNSILLTGDIDPPASSATQSQVGVRISSTTPSNLTLKNNAIAVSVSSNTGTLKHFAIVAPATSYAWGTGGADNNDYYADPSNPQMVLGGIGTSIPYTEVSTLAAWRTQFTPNQDAASFTENPPYVSATDLHLQTSVPTRLESGGAPIASVTTDYDGEARSATTPDVGLDEGVFTQIATNDVRAVAFVNPTNGGSKATGTPFNPSATFENMGLANQTNVVVRFRIVGPLPGTTEVYNDLDTLAVLNSGGGPQAATFPAVTLDTAGTYAMYAKSELPGDEIPANDEINGTFAVLAPLAGTYDVGTAEPAPFNSLTNAIGALNFVGIAGSVVFNLVDASYTTPAETFPLTIGAYPGTDPSYTVTIKPANPGTTITGNPFGAIIVLDGADYVIIDGSADGSGSRDLTISNARDAAGTAVVWVKSLGAGAGATHDTIKNCVLLGGTDQAAGSNESFGVIATDGSISIGTGGADNDDLSVVNNEIRKVRWGVYLLGISGNPNDNNVVTDNLIGPAAFGSEQIGKGGIILRYQNAGFVLRNEVRYVGVLATQAGTATDRVGIGLGADSWTPAATTATSCVVARNLVHDVVDEKTYSAVGIIVAGSGTPSSNVVANNMIHSVRADGTAGDQALGIGIAAGDQDQVVFNSVYLSGDMDPGTSTAASVSAAGIRISATTPTNLTLKNNAIHVDVNSNTSTLKHYAIVAPSTAYVWGTGGCDYNDYYVPAANAQMVLGGIGTSVPYANVTTLAAWRTQFTPNQDAASIDTNPLFASTTNVHVDFSIDPVSPLADIGLSIGGITTDYDGDARSATPDIGADEFLSYTMTVNVVGNGVVTKSPDQPLYNPGRTVTLTAVPDSSYMLVAWSGDASGNANPLPVLMDGNKNITATFDFALGISAADVSLLEGDSGTASALFVVSVVSLRADTIRVDYATEDSTATVADGDYAAASGQLVFPPGVTADSVYVTVNGDALNEADEVFKLRLTNPVNARMLDGIGIATVLNDDPLPTLSIDDLSLTEGTGGTTNAVLTVTLSARSGRTVSLQYATEDGTAVADSDYVAIPLTAMTFPAGDTLLTKTISISVVPDSLDESDEQFYVNLSVAVYAALADSQGVVTIVDDDISEDVGEPIPAVTFMARGFPNPSAGLTTILYGLHESGSVRLEIFDLQGRLVRRLAHGTVEKGYRRAIWDGRDEGGRQVGAGVYFVRLQTPARVFRQTLAIMR